jgi:hypothetical protein
MIRRMRDGLVAREKEPVANRLQDGILPYIINMINMQSL